MRRRSGLSQETLAARAGLSPEAVSLLERGRRSPRMTTMRLLAEGLRLPESDRSALFASANLHEPSTSIASSLRRPSGRPRQGAPRGGRAHRTRRHPAADAARTGGSGQDQDRCRVRRDPARTVPRRCALVPDRDTQRSIDGAQCAGRSARRTRVAEDHRRGDHRPPAAAVEPARDRQRGTSPDDLRRALPRHPGRRTKAHHLDHQSAPHRRRRASWPFPWFRCNCLRRAHPPISSAQFRRASCSSPGH